MSPKVLVLLANAVPKTAPTSAPGTGTGGSGGNFITDWFSSNLIPPIFAVIAFAVWMLYRKKQHKEIPGILMIVLAGLAIFGLGISGQVPVVAATLSGVLVKLISTLPH